MAKTNILSVQTLSRCIAALMTQPGPKDPKVCEVIKSTSESSAYMHKINAIFEVSTLENPNIDTLFSFIYEL